MKTRIFKNTLLFMLFSISSNINYVYSQCQQFQAVASPSVCNNNGTPLDPSDDTYTTQVYIAHDNFPNNTWTSSDGSYTNETYSQLFYSFGPYPISGGNISLTVTDDQNNCSSNVALVAPPTCSQPPVTCPDFDICYQLIEQDLCTATYLVNIDGNLDAYNNINLLNFTFSATGGTIDGVAFITSGGYLQGQGVQISGNTVFGGSGINGDPLTDNYFVVTVSASPGECVKLTCTGGMWFGNTRCDLLPSNICPDAPEFCATGNTISGTVTAPGDIYKCLNSEDNGIEGANITITGPNGENCNTTTSNSGEYSCTFCTEGLFTICASADCPKPCGVSAYDLVLLREYILGIKDWTKEVGIIGDVNGKGGLTTLDLVLIQRAILGLSGPSEQFNWCRFVSVADYEQEPNPAGQDFTSSNLSNDNCIIVSDPSTSTDFLRYMVGDLDGSCSDCVHGDDMGGVGIVMDNDDKSLIIRSGTSDKIFAFTLQIELPLGTEISAIESRLPGLLYKVENNILHIIWIDHSEGNQGVDIAPNESLIHISYTGYKPTNLTLHENYMLGKKSGVVKLYSNNASETRSAKTKVVNFGNLATFEVPAQVTESTITLNDLMGRVITSTNISVIGDQYIPLEPEVSDGIYILTIRYDGTHQSKKVLISNRN